MIFCARCDKPFRDGEPRKTIDRFSPSGPGGTQIVHAYPCKEPPCACSRCRAGRAETE